MREFLPLLVVLLLGCPDGGWTSGDDDTGPADDDDDDTACEAQGEGGQVAVDPECLKVTPYEEFDPVELIEWQWTGSDVDPSYVQVMMTPMVIGLTDDNGDQVVDEQDVPDVVFNSYAGGSYTVDGRMRAISGQDGADLWTISDPAYATNPGSGIATGDIDNDGMAEVIGITDDGEVMRVEHDGTVSWVTAGGYGFSYAHPSIADLHGDGDPEIIVGALILDANGGFVAQGQYGYGGGSYGPINFALDVDHDGVQEIVADNAVYEPDGTALWVNANGPFGYPAVADFDLDNDPELVVVGDSEVHLLDARTGAFIWGPSPLVNEGYGGAPTVADYDGDGYPEIGVAGLGAYTVLDTDGSLMWWNETEDDSSSMTGSSVFDFNGDGVAEVVYADEHVLYVYEGPTGNILFTAESHASGTLWENPVIVDIDHDYSAEIVLASNDMWWEGWCGITVLGAVEQSWYPARGIWNQHAYFITNVEDDGSIPAQPLPLWVEYNSFRRNTLSDESVIHAPNLFIHSAEFCTDACPAELVLQVELANDGLADLTPGLAVSVYRLPQGQSPEFLATEYLPDELVSGAYSAPLSISLDPGVAASEELRIAVDVLNSMPEGLHDECDEDDNTVEMLAPPCH